MSDDALLKRLAERARAQAEEEPRALAQALAAEATHEPPPAGGRPERPPLRSVDTTDSDGHVVEALLEPLPEEKRARIAEAARAALLAREDPGDAAAPGEAMRDDIARAAARRRKPWRWAVAASTTLALAAGMLLFLGRRPPALPGYALEITGAVDRYRTDPRASGQEAVLEIEPGAFLTVGLRPERKPAAEVAARAFWVRGACVRAWQARMEASPEGGIQLTGAAEAPCGAGVGELVVIIGSPGDLPDAPLARRGHLRISRAIRWR